MGSPEIKDLFYKSRFVFNLVNLEYISRPTLDDVDLELNTFNLNYFRQLNSLDVSYFEPNTD